MKFTVKKFTKYLAFRITFPIIAIWVVLGLTLNTYVKSIVYEFVSRSIEEDIIWFSREVLNICNSAVDSMIKSGYSGNEAHVKIIQNRTMLEIEDLLRHYYTDGFLLDKSNEVVFSTNPEINTKTATSIYEPDGLNRISVNGRDYYFTGITFDPWYWTIYILRPSDSYSKLIEDLDTIYFIIIVLLLLAMAVVIYLLYLAVTLPVKKIIFDLRSGSKPDYRGVYEIEFLANSIHEMMDNLESLNRDLENRVEIRTRELAEAKEVAEGATKAKSEFLARMSHEIRTPMNAIIGLTNIVLKGQLQKEQREQLSKVIDSSVHLLDIINDILDFSKVESGVDELDEYDFMLKDLLDRLVSMFRVKAIEGDIEIFFIVEPDVPLILRGDPKKLGQILINLLGNAVKFTSSGSITLRIGLSKNQPESESLWLNFSVKDTGVGIPEDKIAELFQPFTQVDDSNTRQFEGTGLGLSISKSFVDLMGGEITVKSSPGRGAEFTFDARFSGNYDNGKYMLTFPEEFSELKVMVVDSSSASQDFFNEILGNSGITVTQAYSIDEALNLLGEYKYDIFITSWKLEEGTGFDFIKHLNKMINMVDNKRPLVILTTLYEGEADFKEEFENTDGIDDIILKPLNSYDIANVLLRNFGMESYLLPGIIEESIRDKMNDYFNVEGARLLLVEDNETNRDVAVAVLESFGFKVDVAHNGKSAIEKLHNLVYSDSNYYGAVLMDVQMPVMDGYEATRIIRSDSKLKHLVIIAMTANAMEEDRRRCLDSGMNDYVSKPISEQELIGTLQKYFKKKSLLKMPKKLNRKDLIEGNNILNISELSEMLNNNQNLLKKILKSFFLQNRNFTERLQGYYERSELQEAEKLLHALKGSAGNVGAAELYEIAVKAESGIKRHGELKEREIKLIKSAFQRVNREIEKVLEKDIVEADSLNENTVEINKDRLNSYFEELEKYLLKSDSRIMKVFNSIKDEFSETELKEDLENLENFVYNLDTDEALKVLNRIRKVYIRK